MFKTDETLSESQDPESDWGVWLGAPRETAVRLWGAALPSSEGLTRPVRSTSQLPRVAVGRGLPYP